MNPQLITALLQLANGTVSFLAARRGGEDPVEAAIGVLEATDLRPYGIDPEILEIVHIAKAGMSYLGSRGVVVDEAFAMIRAAQEEGVDITEDQVSDALETLVTELEETQDMIDQMED